MGLRPGKNMGGWVGFSSVGPHTPVTFLDKYPPRGSTINKGHFATEKGWQMQNSIYSVRNCMEFLFISVTSTLTTQKYYMSMVWV